MKKLILFLVVLNLISFGQTAEDYFNKGISKFSLEDYNGAVEDFNKAIQLKPDYANAYYNRGRAKGNLKDYTGAIADFNKAIQLKPDYADAYNKRGRAKGNLKDYTGAIADYSKAIQLNPDYADAYNNRGVAKDDLQDYTGAIADYSKAIQLKPNDADAYNNRGVAKYYLKDMNGACKDWTKAGELGSAIALTNIQKNCSNDYPRNIELNKSNAEEKKNTAKLEAELDRAFKVLCSCGCCSNTFLRKNGWGHGEPNTPPTRLTGDLEQTGCLSPINVLLVGFMGIYAQMGDKNPLQSSLEDFKFCSKNCAYNCGR